MEHFLDSAKLTGTSRESTKQWVPIINIKKSKGKQERSMLTMIILKKPPPKLDSPDPVPFVA